MMKSRLFYRVLTILGFSILLAIFLSACKSSMPPKVSYESPAVVVAQRVFPNITMPADSTHPVYQHSFWGDEIYRFYKRRDFTPLWLKKESTSPMADSLLRLFESSRYYGLMPFDYHYNELLQTRKLLSDTAKLAKLEVLFTDGFIRFTNNLRYGRVFNGNEKMNFSGSIVLLDSLASGKGIQTVINGQEPDIPYYRSLKMAMRTVIDSLPDRSRRYLLEGQSHDSIKGFKEVSAIEINLERLRKEQVEWKDRYILVNIPSYTLQVFVHDTISFQSRVIVGDTEHHTPELSSVIECFTLYPYWYVPRKISVEEYLPILQRDRSFITRNNFDVLNRNGAVLSPDSIPWHTFHKDYFPVSLRQREGTENSLGLVKFIFDNPYAVYLHDTNAKRSFSYRVRALSHGCVRVERAMDLAHYLYTGNSNIRSRAIERYVDQKKRTTINLTKPIPLFIRYFTFEFQHGKLHLYEDIYQKDQEIIKHFYRAEARH